MIYGKGKLPLDNFNIFYLIEFGYFLDVVHSLLKKKVDITQMYPIMEYSNNKLEEEITKISEAYRDNHIYKPGKYDKTVVKIYFKDHPNDYSFLEII